MTHFFYIAKLGEEISDNIEIFKNIFDKNFILPYFSYDDIDYWCFIYNDQNQLIVECSLEITGTSTLEIHDLKLSELFKNETSYYELILLNILLFFEKTDEFKTIICKKDKPIDKWYTNIFGLPCEVDDTYVCFSYTIK